MYIELKGDSGRIEQYKEFAGEGNIEIVKDAQSYYITSPELQAMSSDVESYKKGQELLDLLHGISAVIYGGPFGISLGTVNRTPGMQRGSGSSFISARATIVKAPSEDLSLAAKNLISAAKNVPVILECLRYFCLGHPSIFDMYKIYEIIRTDCGGHDEVHKRGYIDKTILNDLCSNINHSKLQGEQARHARMPGRDPKPESYMPIEEMQRTVIMIFNKWVNDKV